MCDEIREPGAAPRVRVFKNKIFSRFARRQRISDSSLCEAIHRAERGVIDADLGSGVIKQRVARPNEGRSGGYRTIIFFRRQERAFFVYGFAKNELDNISEPDLKIFRSTAQETLALTDAQLETLLEKEILIEVNCNEQDNDNQDV